MRKIIHDLRQKSQPQKEQIAFWGALFTTLIIAIVWFSGFSTLNKEQNEKQIANVSSPFAELKNQINLIIKDYKKQKEEYNNQIK